MEYQMEELLPLVQELAGKYTAGESTSVTYEQAEKLMEAILYCIRSYQKEPAGELVPAGTSVDAAAAYRAGYETVLDKTRRARDLFVQIQENFSDYGCRNLHDTFLEGMPKFFLYYDPKFAPQETLLTLDYPTLQGPGMMTGVNAVYQYLQNIGQECGFLNHFPSCSVERLLDGLEPDGRQHYFGNICEAVLLQAMGCMLAGRQADGLTLGKKDAEKIRSIVSGDTKEQLFHRLGRLISWMVGRGLGETEEMEEYLKSTAKGYASRIYYALQGNGLEGVFWIS